MEIGVHHTPRLTLEEVDDEVRIARTVSEEGHEELDGQLPMGCFARDLVVDALGGVLIDVEIAPVDGEAGVSGAGIGQWSVDVCVRVGLRADANPAVDVHVDCSAGGAEEGDVEWDVEWKTVGIIQILCCQSVLHRRDGSRVGQKDLRCPHAQCRG